jgi:hypothetical protein
VWIAGASPSGPWLLSIDHAGVAAEIGALPVSPVAGPGLATFLFATLSQLHAALDRVYKLAVSLPDAPLTRFRIKTKGLPQTTEAEQLVVQRVGQDIFREALMDYWGGRCPLTGITEPALLRASHIVPWADCGDEQRLDVHNGLLLSALGRRLRRGTRQFRQRWNRARQSEPERRGSKGARSRPCAAAEGVAERASKEPRSAPGAPRVLRNEFPDCASRCLGKERLFGMALACAGICVRTVRTGPAIAVQRISADVGRQCTVATVRFIRDRPPIEW